MNLIQQAEALRNLSDEQLTSELRSPSGGAAPFMVASEMSRRKDMRSRYAAEAAKKSPQTTVMDDLMSGGGGLGDAAAAGMSPMTNMGGVGATPPARVGFAEGGLVDYADIEKRYLDMLETSETDKSKALGLALLAAGAGMATGGHGATLANVGEGITKGIDAYTGAMNTTTSNELNALRGLSDLGSMQHSQELQRLQEDRLARQFEADMAPKAPEPTADMRNFEWYKNLSPEDKALYDARNPVYNPNQLTGDQRLTDLANDEFNRALNSLPPPSISESIDTDPTELGKVRQKQAAQLAYPRWVALLGPARAAEMARSYGLTEGDIAVLSGASTTPGVDMGGKDPLGLGL